MSASLGRKTGRSWRYPFRNIVINLHERDVARQHND
jgi:hypothetical protein